MSALAALFGKSVLFCSDEFAPVGSFSSFLFCYFLLLFCRFIMSKRVAVSLDDVDDDNFSELSELSEEESVIIEAEEEEGCAEVVDLTQPNLLEFLEQVVGESEEATERGKKKARKDNRVRRRPVHYTLGDKCTCRSRCFDVVPEDKQEAHIALINSFNSKNEVDAHISSLIRIHPVRQRIADERQRNQKVTAEYVIPLLGDPNDSTVHISVCRIAFMSMTGIKDRGLRRLVDNLSRTGATAVDMRGKHNNRANKYPEETIRLVMDHIRSLKARRSHYSLKKSKKFYISEDLTILKLCEEFNRLHPGHAVDRIKYGEIFNTRFNISIGYPRSDTCTKCNELESTILLAKTPEEKMKTEREKAGHLVAAQQWYDLKNRKTEAAKQAGSIIEVLAFDFQKNLPIPNVTSNDVYYKRQLSLISFNVHNIRTGCATFCIYDETQGRKGASDVVTMLNLVLQEIPPEKSELWLFCDNCFGQNKNITVFKFLYRLVHIEKKFQAVTISFPIRGHSYMECDRDMTNINQKTVCETAEQWMEVFRGAVSKPKPFEVVPMQWSDFKDWSSYLERVYPYKPKDLKIQSVRQMSVDIKNPGFFLVRRSFEGDWETHPVLAKRKATVFVGQLQNSYDRRIPLKAAKVADLKSLRSHCQTAEGRDLIDNLS